MSPSFLRIPYMLPSPSSLVGESQEPQRLFLIEAAEDRLMPRRNALKT